MHHRGPLLSRQSMPGDEDPPRCGSFGPGPLDGSQDDRRSYPPLRGKSRRARAATIAPPTPGDGARMKLEISYRGGTTHEVELPGSVIVLGRDPGCDVVLNDSKCSRRHAVVEEGPEGVVVRDEGSANGIYVNGRRVEKASLQPGDTLRLGDVQLKLLAEVGETVIVAPDDFDLRTAAGAPRPPDPDLPLRALRLPRPCRSARAPRCARRPSRGGPRRGPAGRPRSASWRASGPSSCPPPSPPASSRRTGWAAAPWPGLSAPWRASCWPASGPRWRSASGPSPPGPATSRSRPRRSGSSPAPSRSPRPRCSST